MQIRNKSDVEEDFDSETVCVCVQCICAGMCLHDVMWTIDWQTLRDSSVLLISTSF